MSLRMGEPTMAINKNIKNKEASTEKNTKPVAKFQAGVVQASVWENIASVDGKEQKFHTISFQRSYKDKEDKWQNTNTMRVNDLPKLALVIEEAYKTLVLDDKSEE
jgi:hypothetical protein